MKRDPRLRGLSSDHHHALVLARRLTERVGGWDEVQGRGLFERFHRELEPHFQVEEIRLLPALPAAHADLVRRTRADHAALRELVARAGRGDAEAVAAFASLLVAHVRFEESELFPVCEASLPNELLDAVALCATAEPR